MFRPKTEKQQLQANKPKIMRAIKRKLIADGLIMDPANRPPKFIFKWTWGELSGTVQADDKAAARGLIKKDLGIPKKKRLPQGVVIEREVNIMYYQGLAQTHANLTQPSDGEAEASAAVGGDTGESD